jgi:hypothetical protein
MSNETVISPIATMEPKTSVADNINDKTPLQLELDSDASFNSMSDLQQKAPELYRFMQIGIGLKICADLRKHASKMRQIHREGRAH